MLFNSIDFFIFLPVVFILYWLVANKNLIFQNLLLLAASYFFYACWDWRFVFLLIFSTCLDFYSGIKISKASNITSKRFWFWLSVSVNLGFLCLFKYYNFFASSFIQFIAHFGLRIDPFTINVILPVGISFYTFHGLSYIIDIYKGAIKPERNFVNYSVFVSFFPLLIAGPIERATHLLPQLKTKRNFDYNKSIDGCRQILWGLFKKIVIADQCALYCNHIFRDSANYSGSSHVLAAVLFAIQIYCDFSGYTDIAIGIAKLFGIELLRNFAFPYFSRDIAEFWRRWHISLSSWFKDYLYIPLGGSKGGTLQKTRNIFIVFIASALWHGANWTFIAWGLLNAIYIMPSIFLKTNRNNLEIVAKGKILPTFKETLAMVVTFGLIVFSWIFFRAESIGAAFKFISKILSFSLFSIPAVVPKGIIIFIPILFMVEWAGREHSHALECFGNKGPRLIRLAVYYLLIFVIFYYAGPSQNFIYFQF
ncbi:MAG: hypothetical protein JWP94_1476 [Mucilaginibacter sp.]|nr:hypothetical protein [Mucilaginibacter sp.]